VALVRKDNKTLSPQNKAPPTPPHGRKKKRRAIIKVIQKSRNGKVRETKSPIGEKKRKLPLSPLGETQSGEKKKPKDRSTSSDINDTEAIMRKGRTPPATQKRGKKKPITKQKNSCKRGRTTARTKTDYGKVSKEEKKPLRGKGERRKSPRITPYQKRETRGANLFKPRGSRTPGNGKQRLSLK